ncbi:uncharacterized protein [Hemitrygon akajei]|uniref:uncharacterized protein isoform X4 n=1 Tax=Hemitrygon akajei TaxID=2704970 RepID=UPI003BF9662D
MFISLGWKLPRRNRCCSSALRVEKRKHGPKYRDANGGFPASTGFPSLVIAVHRFNQDLQQPGVLTVPKGNSILLNCSYSMPTLSKFQVSWTFSNDGSRTSKIIANKTSINFWVSHSRYCVRHNSTLKTFTLTITDVQVSDNGTYFCEVFGKIPPPNFRAQGNGTLLSVTERKKIQEQKRIQASNRTLDLGQNNMNENCKEEVCYAKLQWGTMQRARMHEEVVYSPVLH